jgi:hypothetical protein
MHFIYNPPLDLGTRGVKQNDRRLSCASGLRPEPNARPSRAFLSMLVSRLRWPAPDREVESMWRLDPLGAERIART